MSRRTKPKGTAGKAANPAAVMDVPAVDAVQSCPVRARLLDEPFRYSAATTSSTNGSYNPWFEGAERNRLRNRPASRLEGQDRTIEWTREGLISEARALANTLDIVGAIKRKVSEAVVGTCAVKWDTGNPEVDRAYEEAWMMSRDQLDARGQHGFCKLTDLVVQNCLTDGDLFPQRILRAGQFRLQLIEADRVKSTAWGSADLPGLIGGVHVDAIGRPTGYQVWDRTQWGGFENGRTIPKADMGHVWDSSRVDAYRGVTAFAPVLNALRDLKETVDAEITSAKVNSRLALIAKNITGQAKTLQDNLGIRVDRLGNSSNSIEELGQGVIKYMFPNEDISAHQSNRPGDGWMNLVIFFIHKVAVGLGLPFSVVWSMASSSGPAVRADLEAADRTYQAFHGMLAQLWFKPVIGTWISNEIARKRLPESPKWWNFRVRKPRKLSVDRNTIKGDIEAMKYGILSPFDFADAYGFDLPTIIDQCGLAAALIHQAAAKYKVDVAEIRLLTPNGASASESGNAPEPAGNPDGDANNMEEPTQ